jgi:hypothetical protein
MNRIVNGIKSIDKVIEGVYNFNNPNAETETLAKSRSETCKGCKFFVNDPIEELHVNDRIEILSKKMCELCGCVLSYKLRTKKIKKLKNCLLND